MYTEERPYLILESKLLGVGSVLQRGGLDISLEPDGFLIGQRGWPEGVL